MDYYAIHFYNKPRIHYQREYWFIQTNEPAPVIETLGNQPDPEEDQRYMLFLSKLRLNSHLRVHHNYNVEMYDATLAEKIREEGRRYLNEIKKTMKIKI